jgi:hypothetical protein
MKMSHVEDYLNKMIAEAIPEGKKKNQENLRGLSNPELLLMYRYIYSYRVGSVHQCKKLEREILRRMSENEK